MLCIAFPRLSLRLSSAPSLRGSGATRRRGLWYGKLRSTKIRQAQTGDLLIGTGRLEKARKKKKKVPLVKKGRVQASKECVQVSLLFPPLGDRSGIERREGEWRARAQPPEGDALLSLRLSPSRTLSWQRARLLTSRSAAYPRFYK